MGGNLNFCPRRADENSQPFGQPGKIACRTGSFSGTIALHAGGVLKKSPKERER
jgi:hypothetical protein